MNIAFTFSELSRGRRLKVGALLVKKGRIISFGYNGTPAGFDNACEYDDKTKSDVLHAEANCILKLANSNDKSTNSVLFVTHSPCMECAKLIYQANIKKVYFKEYYRNKDGLEFLSKVDIKTEKID